MAKKYLKQLELYEAKRRDSNDRRKKVAWAVFSYIEHGTGDEYRKVFTAPAGTPETEMIKLAPEMID